ncbi:carboxypeptidase regulatory-like domain-containing protein [Methanosarcina sp. T3]|uniref:carboxypeptidase regulatory-like domain-containing protein n=1 Tax=Methanosarcina sp. T3 TaxID=3439062 RepID=UPI003F8415B7
MKSKNLFISFLISICFFSTNCSGSVINVGPGTSFSPAGSDDQKVINAAIESANSGDTVQLASTTFHINSPIIMKSGVTLNGNGIGATVIYCDNPSSNFATQNIIHCEGVSDIEISNFLIDGGWESLSIMHAASNRYREYEKGVYLRGCSNVAVHDLKMQYSMGDFIYCSRNTNNIQVYNTVCKPGHDSFDAWSAGDGISMYNNCWGTFINSCIKIHNTKNVQIYKNTFYTDTGSGNAGVEVMGGDVTGLNIHNNIFSTLRLNTIYQDLADGASSGSGTVSNNIFYNSPSYNGIGGLDIVSTGNIVTSSYSCSRGTEDYGYVADNGTRNLPDYNGSVIPSVTFPADDSTISTVNGYVSISWSYLNATSYSINVYNSASQFDSSHIIYSLNTSQTSANVPISFTGTYAVKIGAHDDVHNSWVYNSPVSFFTVNGKKSATVYSGVYGYLTDAATGQPVQSAVITLSNDQEDCTQITDVDGLYHFTVNNGEGTYCLTASATGYHNSPELPVNMTGINTEINLKMVKTPDYSEPHYVQLYVCTDSNESVPGCEIRIYAPNNDLANEKPNFCAWTNNDGRATFHLTRDVTYKIVTITLDGQKYASTLTPNLDQHIITIPSGDTSAIPPMQTVISTNCTYKQINNTAAYINASYYDSSSQSSDLIFVLGTMSEGKTFVPLGISGTNDNVSNPVGVITDSFIVTDCSGKTYTVKISAQSQTYGAVYETVNVTVPGSNVPDVGSTYMSYFCVLILIIAGLVLSKTRKAH